jgi:hypothetical protein
VRLIESQFRMAVLDGRRVVATADATGCTGWRLKGHGLCWVDPMARRVSPVTKRLHPEFLVVRTRKAARAAMRELLRY